MASDDQHDDGLERDALETDDSPPDTDFHADTEAPGATLRALLAPLRRHIEKRPELAGWFARWIPVVLALQRLGATATRFLRYVRADAAPDDTAPDDAAPDDAAALPDDAALRDEREQLLDELAAGFSALTDAFPDVADVFFGVEGIDAFVEALVFDAEGQARLSPLLEFVTGRAERLIAKLVELAFFPSREPAFSAEQLRAFAERAERLLDATLERWVLPHLDIFEEKR